jgi:hypothetical protein
MHVFNLADADNEGEESCLSLKGEVLPDSSAFSFDDTTLHGTFWGASIPKIGALSVGDFSPQFASVTIQFPGSEENLAAWEFDEVEFKDFARRVTSSPSLSFPVRLRLSDWAMPYSITELAATLEAVLAEDLRDGFLYYQEDPNFAASGFGAEKEVSSAITIEEVISFSIRLSQISQIVKQRLRKPDEEDSLVRTFEFPDTIRSACEQYLIYFGQFLRDLGIEADSRIREQARQVLFEVTPREGKQALTKIRAALALYLQLPFDSDFGMTASGFTDFAVFQMKANVMHLQSQLVLANAIVQAKDALIATQSDRIADFEQRVNSERIVAASTKEKETDSEPLIPGLVSVKNFDWKFMRIQTAEDTSQIETGPSMICVRKQADDLNAAKGRINREWIVTFALASKPRRAAFCQRSPKLERGI